MGSFGDGTMTTRDVVEWVLGGKREGSEGSAQDKGVGFVGEAFLALSPLEMRSWRGGGKYYTRQSLPEGSLMCEDQGMMEGGGF